MISRKLSIIFSGVFLLFATPAQAGWYNQLPTKLQTFEAVKEVRVQFQGKGGGLIATFETKDGNCIQFKATKEKITHARKCGEEDWAEFVGSE